MKRVPPTTEGLAEAVEALRAGAVVAYPTETVYGLAADPFSEAALDVLFALKARDPAQPVLLVVADAAQLEQIAAPSAAAKACIEAFWPGPLSLTLPARDGLPARLLGPDGKVCARCPASRAARELCAAFGAPLTSTSANRSGAPPAASLDDLDLPGLTLALDGGALPHSPPSTVYDPDTGAVLRPGAVDAALLARFRGR